MAAQRGHQGLPIDLLVDAAGVDHDGFVLEEAAGVGHALGQRGNEAFGVCAVQNHPDGIQGGAFEVQG
ncbi:hypothetical protein G6F60_015215 [Rhizopus arrhizus]|nr:hypothetical protein G6F68_021630 [Rhizopus microsporus]KAG1380074.1 hypothetical protein G6F60_015215 [Rhizopus arrhizus]